MPWKSCKKKRNTCSWAHQNRDTADPLYLQIPDLQFTSLLKCVCIPQVNTHSTFLAIRSHVQDSEIFELPTHITSWVWTRQCSAFLSQRSDCQVFYSWPVQCHVFHIFVLFVGLKRPPSRVLKCGPGVRSTRRPSCPLQRKSLCY